MRRLVCACVVRNPPPPPPSPEDRVSRIEAHLKIFSLERRTGFCALKMSNWDMFLLCNQTYVFDRILLKLFSKSKCISNLIQFNQYMDTPSVFFVGHMQTVQTRSDAVEGYVWSGSPLFAYRMLLKVIKFEWAWKIPPTTLNTEWTGPINKSGKFHSAWTFFFSCTSAKMPISHCTMKDRFS